MLARFCAGNLFYLGDCTLVPSAKRLHRDGQEVDALSAAQLPGLVHLSVVGNGQSMAGGGGCSPDKRSLEGVDDGNVKRGIFPASPVRDVHIRRFAPRPRQQGPPLLGWAQACSHRSVVQLIPEPVVPGNSLTMPGTVQGVVAKVVALLTASWARAASGIDGVAKPQPEGSDKLLRLE